MKKDRGGNERQTCEVKLASHARVGLYIQMDGISVRDSSGGNPEHKCLVSRRAGEIRPGAE